VTTLPTIALVAAAAAALWLIILLLPWQPWRNDIVLRVSSPTASVGDVLCDVTVVIPARDEVAVIGQTLAALAQQGAGLRVLVVDDGSTDGTVEVARAVPGLDLRVVQGQPLPQGWTGKVWALEQGTRQVETPYTLLIDADVALDPGVVAALVAQLRAGSYQMVSVMASLHMVTVWEKLLAPSFTFFFKLLYPFRLASTRNPHFYSAAGGCILVEARALAAIGGYASIRGALIDDCALARELKRAGYRTWIGQSRAVRSIRPYRGLRELWNMVARSAYTQLRYSPAILALTTAAMATLFLAPPAALLWPEGAARLLGLAGYLLMVGIYVPTLHYYDLSPLWALLMPLVGALYLSMTWSSALRYWRGVRSKWKGRVYR
jgi:hopene-associated glycosyltransferase HpnB